MLPPFVGENIRSLMFPRLLVFHLLQPEAGTKRFVESFQKLFSPNVGTCFRLAASPKLFLCPCFWGQELHGTVFLGAVLGTLLRKVSLVYERDARIRAGLSFPDVFARSFARSFDTKTYSISLKVTCHLSFSTL